MSSEQRAELLEVLKARFEKNMKRHKGLECAKVEAKLEANAETLWSLKGMEKTGGEPDVVGHDIKMATDMGIELLSEEQYLELQKLGNFDTKTSSWIKAPADIRNLGGAVFADYRYGNVFVYHNGAESY